MPAGTAASGTNLQVDKRTKKLSAVLEVMLHEILDQENNKHTAVTQILYHRE